MIDRMSRSDRGPWRAMTFVAPAVVAGILALPAGPSAAQAPGDPSVPPRIELDRVVRELEPEIRRAMVDGRIPSLTIALVAGDRIVWAQGYGEANLYYRAPATTSTVYIIASTLKTMVSAAVLQLWEDGVFNLDDPVRDYLGDLEIRDEDPARPVTFRHLLTHTSGLPTVFSPTPVWSDTVPMPLEPYLRERLRVVGPPMERVRYSNIGYALLGYLVERLTGVELRTWIRNRIFAPMEMGSTDFVPSPEMIERMATPYVVDEATGSNVAADRVRFAEWPAGGAWGTVLDQARWLAMQLNDGSYAGQRILDPATIELAHTRQFPQFGGPMAGGWGGDDAGYGLTWWTATRDGERYVAHSGSVRGYTAFLHGNRDRRFGVAILTNGHRAHEHLVHLSFLATDLMARHPARVGR